MITSVSSPISTNIFTAASANVSGQRSPTAQGSGRAESGKADVANSASVSTISELSAEQLQQIQQLVAIDRKVRAHEQAHLAAAADLARSSANFGYTTGPDNRQYAVSGEVSIDVSEARTPQETITKAQRIRAAALAPADPSAQDNRVAALASQMENEARAEVARLAQDESVTTRSNPGEAGAQAYRVVSEAGVLPSATGSGLDLFA